MLVLAFQSEIWIAENFNSTVFEEFCLSLSWKQGFSQNETKLKFNSKPITDAHFSSIWQGEYCLGADCKS